jgi:hypothetical protein
MVWALLCFAAGLLLTILAFVFEQLLLYPSFNSAIDFMLFAPMRLPGRR